MAGPLPLPGLPLPGGYELILPLTRRRLPLSHDGDVVPQQIGIGFVKSGRVNEVLFTILLKVERSSPNGTAMAAVGSASGRMRTSPCVPSPLGAQRAARSGAAPLGSRIGAAFCRLGWLMP
jgi:hypothetical protein